MPSTTEASDFDLVERWRDGDRHAGDKIVRHHYPALRRFFFAKVREETEREDLIQDTLFALTTAIARFEGRSSFKIFLFSIARHKLYGHMRTRYRSGGALDPLMDSVEDVLGTSPSSHAALREQGQQLLAAMATLPVDDQIMLELWYWHEMSGRELGEVFELSSDAIRGRLLRARRALQRKLAPRRVEPGGAAIDSEALEHEQLEQGIRALGLELD